jgi:hypothetical protein
MPQMSNRSLSWEDQGRLPRSLILPFYHYIGRLCAGAVGDWVEGQSPEFAIDVIRIDANPGGDQEHHKRPNALASLDHGVRDIHQERC